MPQDPMDSGELLSHLFLMSALANLTTFRVIACTMLSAQSHGTLSTIINLSEVVPSNHLAGTPGSGPGLPNQRLWYVQPCLCDWACKRSCATYCKE